MKLSYTIGIAMLGLALLAGCRSKKGPEVVRYDEFPANYKSHSVRDACEAQAAVGNRADATLRVAHFDGSKLNSLGEAKLASMLKSDRSNNMVTIYVDVPNDDVNAPRKTAIKAFLKSRGIADTQIALKEGANPTGGAMAARGVMAIEEMRSQSGSANAGAAEMK